MSKFYQLKVLETKQQTQDSVSVSFDVPHDLYETFNYKPGQYLTLKFNLNGEEVRRSYSLCSTPVLEEPLQVGVKRVENGLVSNHINDHVSAGSVVQVMPPDGRFFADVKKDNYKTYYLFAAGSGITPILSILKTVLLTEEKSFVHMIYGNRNQDSIMFKDELNTLQEEYKDRLALVHTLSKPKSSFWSSKQKMEHRKGRVDSDAVKWFVDEFPPYAQNAEYFICGPGTMIENTKQALQNIDVPEERIHIESFGDTKNESADSNTAVKAKLTATLDDETVEITVPEGKTILRALIDNKYDPPYSCEGGVCSTCICVLKKGKVHMHNNISLTDKEIEQGYILSCQSVPLTDEVEVEYE
ncbi:2Fe-2S iron-sulfur cluster-binding protein [Winogradskyella sp. 3972H.M.0a.05]|uniref:2Fe-2S iron-sulfur cluster-binding protein n=1 Tax=Winogradskyella sp. 3972H.M.0a.05 TaxID=2950277 RepID=UPI00339476BA